MTVEVIDYVMPEVVIGHPEKYHQLLRMNSGFLVGEMVEILMSEPVDRSRIFQ
jgi:hypothetical protein